MDATLAKARNTPFPITPGPCHLKKGSAPDMTHRASNKSLLTARVLGLGMALSSALSLFVPSIASAAAGNKLGLDVYTAGESGFGVTSTLIYGKHDAILVDTQFLNSDAEKLAQRIKAKGKHLTAIIITHPHPDHYFGTGVVLKHFPGTPVYMTAAGVAEFKKSLPGKLKTWGPIYKDEVPTRVPTPQVLPTTKFSLEGQAVEVQAVPELQGDVMSRTNSYVWVPSLGAQIGGDIVFNQVHPWLAESNAETRAAWMGSLQKMRAQHPQIVVAGHKKSAAVQDGPEALAFTTQYLKDFEAAVAASQDAKGLVSSVTAKYPALGLPVMLDYAAQAAFPQQ